MPPQEPDLPAALDRGPGLDSPDEPAIECSLVEGAVLSGRKFHDLRIDQCRLVRVDLSDAEISRARIVDAIFEAGSWANIRTAAFELSRVAFKGVRMTGAGLASSVLQDVTFAECRIDLAFLASARLKRVHFRACQLDEADFSGATLSSVVFEGCSLNRVRWTDATVAQSEMRRCDLAGSIDVARLRGMRMPMDDVLANAAELAVALGIEIVGR